MSNFSIQFTINRANWLKNPNLRWRAGLDGAGLQFRQRLQRSNYGTPPAGAYPSTYVRTGTLANKAAWRTFETGSSLYMQFGSTHYLQYLWYGTGIYGYRGQPITPINAQFLSWQAGGEWIHAKSVRGTIWEGHMDETVKQMEAGFKEGVRNYKE